MTSKDSRGSMPCAGCGIPTPGNGRYRDASGKRYTLCGVCAERALVDNRGT